MTQSHQSLFDLHHLSLSWYLFFFLANFISLKKVINEMIWRFRATVSPFWLWLSVPKFAWSWKLVLPVCYQQEPCLAQRIRDCLMYSAETRMISNHVISGILQKLVHVWRFWAKGNANNDLIYMIWRVRNPAVIIQGLGLNCCFLWILLQPLVFQACEGV